MLQVEFLAQPHDGAAVDLAGALQLGNEGRFGLFLGQAGDGAEQGGIHVVEHFDGPVGQGVGLDLPEFPTDVAVHVLGVETQLVQHDAGGVHDVDAHPVAGHPTDLVLGHFQSP